MKENQNKRTLSSLMGIIAIGAVISLGLAGCGDPDPGGNPGGGDNPLGLPKIDEPTTGRDDVINSNITLESNSEADVTGVTLAQTIEGGAGTWSITAGKFSLTLGTPSTSSTTAVSTWVSSSSPSDVSWILGNQLFNENNSGFDGSEVTVTPISDAQILAIQRFTSSFGSSSYEIQRIKRTKDATYNEINIAITYVYVDQDVIFNREAKSVHTEDPYHGSFTTNYTAFNLPLKAGWNLVQTEWYETDTSATYTVKIADTDVPWRVRVSESPYGSLGLPRITEPTTGVPPGSKIDTTLEGDDAATINISEQTLEGGAGIWSVTAGEFSFTLGTPSTSSTTAVSTWISSSRDLFYITSAGEVTVNNSDAKILSIRNFSYSSDGTRYTIRREKEGPRDATIRENDSTIIYVYVDQEVTLNRAAKSAHPGSSYDSTFMANYSAFNLPLKTGWNLVQLDWYETTTSIISTVKIADTDIPWSVRVN